ncbi:MAG: ATP-binding protein [Pseudomonadota bacterium]
MAWTTLHLVASFAIGIALALAILRPDSIAIAVGLAGLGVTALGIRKRPQVQDRRSAMIVEAIQSLPMPVAVYDSTDRLVTFNDLYMEHHPEAARRIAADDPEAYPTYEELVAMSFPPGLSTSQRMARLQSYVGQQPPDDGRLRERNFPRFGWLRIGKKRLPSGGNVRVAIDVNELKDREAELLQAIDRAAAADRAKVEFLARMSHELRTPLNGIIGMANLLISGRLPAREADNAEMIRRSGLHLLSLINDLLDHAKFQGAGWVAESVPFDITELIGDVLTEARASQQAAGLQVTADYAPGLARHRVGDPRALRQILTNLVGNAVKFTERGSVTVRVREDGGDLELCVIDTGIGIPEAARKKVFEPFRQADSSMTRRYGGTGLGLTITAEIVTALGGAISIDGSPSGGTIFTVSLPLQEALKEPA